MPIPTRLVFPASALLLLSCSGTPEPAPPEEPAPPIPAADEHPAEPPPGPHLHMQQHMEAVTNARNAVILGDVDEAKGPMSWLAEHEPPADKMPRGWQPYMAAIQGHATKAASAENVPEVAELVALTARECGACHTSMGAKPTFATLPVPGGDGVKAHMARHQWAADRMWEGIISADGDRWRDGAMTLLEDPLHELSLPGTSPVPGAVSILGDKLHNLGEEGLGTMDDAAQARLYGEVIAACGTCHSVTGGGPEGESDAPANGTGGE